MNVHLLIPDRSLQPPLEWLHIPPFAVITGHNGTGKTQFLTAMYEALDHHSGGLLNVSDFTAQQGEVIFLPEARMPGGSAAVVSSVTDATNLYDHLKDNLAAIGSSFRRRSSYLNEAFIERLRREGLPPYEQFLMLLMREHLHEFDFLGQGLATLIAQYQGGYKEWRSRGKTDGEIREFLGQPPWIVLNKLMIRSMLPLEFVGPERHTFGENYELKVLNTNTGAQITLPELSSGERVIVSMIIWLYSARESRKLPKLLLLDEPDSHLHPSLARQLMAVLAGTLVAEHGVRVIMTTHSATTVAFAPEGAVFEMARENPRIRPVASVSRAIRNLTDGYAIVTRDTVFVLVEDEDDESFYTKAHRIAKRAAADEDRNLVFISVSRGPGGGRKEVEKWVGKFGDQEGLAIVICGLVDRDAEASRKPRVVSLRRGSIESFLCDPLVVFACLLTQGKAPSVPGLDLRDTDQYGFSRRSADDLQRIADVIFARLEASELGTGERLQFRYLTGQTVMYPGWLRETRGKDILSTARDCFGGGGVINVEGLLDTFGALGLIPEDLAQSFRELEELSNG